MTRDPAIEVEALHKRFGDVVALDGLDLIAPEGQVLALLGPNGAGKTTLVRALATLLVPDAGRARVLGLDVVADPLAVRRAIGLAGQFAAVDEILTGRENLEMVGMLYHLGRAESARRARDVLERFELTDAADRRAGCAGGLISPQRWSGSRACWSSTSRPRGSIPAVERSCGTWFANCAARERRSC